MKVTKEIHSMWKAEKGIMALLPKGTDWRLIGKWHYHYENKNGIVGLIKIRSPWHKPRWLWEACGVLDFQKFATRKDAEVEIYKELKETIRS